MLKFNEGKVCEAIVRRVEAREGTTRADVQWPEMTNHEAPVELVWQLGSQLFALEHTGIEPFDGHMKMEAKEDRHFGPIKDSIMKVIPSAEVWELSVPAKAFQERKKREVEQIQTALIDWITQTAPALPRRPYADYKAGAVKAIPLGVPFPVSLYRFRAQVMSEFPFIIRHSTGTREEAQQTRADRLRRACENKFPKLYAWKRDKGARTVLVLEENDIFTTNESIVARTFLSLAQARDDRRDETYLVSTALNKPWYGWPILVENRSLRDFEEAAGDRFIGRLTQTIFSN